jgi:hypothetical protein
LTECLFSCNLVSKFFQGGSPQQRPPTNSATMYGRQSDKEEASSQQSRQ